MEKVKDNTESIIDKDFEKRIKARYLKFIIEDTGEDEITRVGDVEIYGTKIINDQ